MANGKDSKGMLTMVMTSIAIMSALFGVGICWGSFSKDIEQNSQSRVLAIKNKESVIQIQTDLVYIKEKVDEIYKRVMRINP